MYFAYICIFKNQCVCIQTTNGIVKWLLWLNWDGGKLIWRGDIIFVPTFFVIFWIWMEILSHSLIF